MKNIIIILMTSLVLAIAGGCEESQKKETPAAKAERLEIQNAELEKQLAQVKSENQALKKENSVLAGLKEGQKAEKIYEIQAVKIGRFTNFYDKDKNGSKEKLIVYIQPIDKNGDTIKAAGSVEVELWDLNKKAEQAVIGKWEVSQDELEKKWSPGLLSTNYRLVFDAANIIDSIEGQVAVKVQFTDYLSGKVFTDEKIIKK